MQGTGAVANSSFLFPRVKSRGMKLVCHLHGSEVIDEWSHTYTPPAPSVTSRYTQHPQWQTTKVRYMTYSAPKLNIWAVLHKQLHTNSSMNRTTYLY